MAVSIDELKQALAQMNVGSTVRQAKADLQTQLLWELLGALAYVFYSGFMFRSRWSSQIDLIAWSAFTGLSFYTSNKPVQSQWVKNLAIGYIGGEIFLKIFMALAKR